MRPLHWRVLGVAWARKRPKLSSTPPLSALGRLAGNAVAEERAISPSIKRPSVVRLKVNTASGHLPESTAPASSQHQGSERLLQAQHWRLWRMEDRSQL